MFYIHHITSISPQHTFTHVDLEILTASSQNKLTAIEPVYEGIPQNSLRRMGKAVKISVGAALPIMKKTERLDGIIIGTANGGMEDCIKFMNQIIEYDEGMLTPGNFVQSTPNGIAAQLGLLNKNKLYNATHVHRGHSFEHAALDAAMLLHDYPDANYLLGATDEISTYNYNVDFLAGWYKKETVANKDLYSSQTPASIAGEGSAMLLVKATKENAIAKLEAIHTWHGEDQGEIPKEIKAFLDQHCASGAPGILISGENGDIRLLPYYAAAEQELQNSTVLRFKHMMGEFPTAVSQAVWLACEIFKTGKFPEHMLKTHGTAEIGDCILIYNSYKGVQHSLLLLKRV